MLGMYRYNASVAPKPRNEVLATGRNAHGQPVELTRETRPDQPEYVGYRVRTWIDGAPHSGVPLTSEAEARALFATRTAPPAAQAVPALIMMARYMAFWAVYEGATLVSKHKTHAQARRAMLALRNRRTAELDATPEGR